VDHTALFIAGLAPGILVSSVGIALTVYAALRRRSAVLMWGQRLFFLGLALLFALPGIGIVIGVLVGELMWPALIYPVLTLPVAFGVFYGLRRWWADPTAGSGRFPPAN
jgi:hypothetical protein